MLLSLNDVAVHYNRIAALKGVSLRVEERGVCYVDWIKRRG